jgi:heme-degrading monooxygenase HmoA
MAFRVMLTMQIRPGMEHEFEQTWHRVGGTIVQHPANLGHWLSRDSTNPSTYYVVSDWADEPRFREFEHSAEHVEHRTKLHPYRSGGSMVTMDIVDGMTGAGAVT